MTRGGVRTALALAGTVAAAALLGGCDIADSGTNLVNGKQQFVAKCGSCHVLKRAGATGVTGPNLDAAFERARADGFGQSTFEGLVHKQILHPAINPQRDPQTGKLLPKMPPALVTGDDAEDVAAYVASAAGRPGEDTGALAQVGGAKAEGTAKAKAGKLEIPVGVGLSFKFANAEAPAGKLTIDSVNDQSTDHNIAVDGNGVDEKGDVVNNGGTSEIQVDLKPGEYSFYCSVPGHREGGMEGKLTIK